MSKKHPKDEFKDEPGAAERFNKIMGRVLHTPPKRKPAKRAVSKSVSGKTQETEQK